MATDREKYASLDYLRDDDQSWPRCMMLATTDGEFVPSLVKDDFDPTDYGDGGRWHEECLRRMKATSDKIKEELREQMPAQQ